MQKRFSDNRNTFSFFIFLMLQVFFFSASITKQSMNKTMYMQAHVCFILNFEFTYRIAKILDEIKLSMPSNFCINRIIISNLLCAILFNYINIF